MATVALGCRERQDDSNSEWRFVSILQWACLQPGREVADRELHDREAPIVAARRQTAEYLGGQDRETASQAGRICLSFGARGRGLSPRWGCLPRWRSSRSCLAVRDKHQETSGFPHAAYEMTPGRNLAR